MQLKKLRKDTLDALGQMPLCIERAQFFMRTYGHPQVNQQVETLYIAIIEALQHILEWYKRAAGCKSPDLSICECTVSAKKIQDSNKKRAGYHFHSGGHVLPTCLSRTRLGNNCFDQGNGIMTQEPPRADNMK